VIPCGPCFPGSSGRSSIMARYAAKLPSIVNVK
jgi:hypothetical protein